MNTLRRRAVSIAALTLIAPVVAFAVERLTFKPGFNLFSSKQDIEVGRQNAAEVDKQMPLVKDPQVVNYVSNLGLKLTRYEPIESEYPWTFKVVDSREINAFALPGGFIYVNRGAIESAEGEAQLAGVIAHETGHVVMRHGTHQASQMMLAQMPLALLGGMLGQSSSLMSQLAQLGVGLGVNSIFLHNSRGAETQADEVGAYVLYHAGYDPHAMGGFFQIIEQKYPQRTIQFFSDHPNPENRIKNVEALIPRLGPALRGGGVKDSQEFQTVKKRLLGMSPPPKEKETGTQQPQTQQGESGSVAVVKPSGNFRSFNHDAFTLSYPDNWEVFGDTGSAVTIAPRAGISQNAVAYGAIINEYQPERGRQASLDTATHQLIEMLRRANPEMKVVANPENIRVNRVRGKSVELIGASPIRDQRNRALAERDWLVTLQRSDGTLLYIIFISPERDYKQLLPTFNQMLRTFRVR